MKALLQESKQPAPRIHDLAILLDLLVGQYPELGLLRPQLKALTAYAVEFRYPGASATKPLARQAYHDCAAVREAARRLLGLPAQVKPSRSKTGPSRRR